MEEIELLRNDIISIATESYRFETTFNKMLEKLEYDEKKKYVSQFAWFKKRVEKAIQDAGYNVIDLKGQPYDPGMAVIPLNIEDFDSSDELFVDYFIEPIIMKDGCIVKEGTVILKKGYE